jgi:hypothetical protein
MTFQKAQNRKEWWESRWCSTWEADDENSEPIWDRIKTAEFVLAKNNWFFCHCVFVQCLSKQLNESM